MRPADPRSWRRVPGYASDDEDDQGSPETVEPSQEEKEERLHHIQTMLGHRLADRPFIKFQPVGLPGTSKSQHAPNPARGRVSIMTSPLVTPLFRIEASEAPILRETFVQNGLVATKDTDYLIMWAGPGIKDPTYQNLHEFQRINHFPGSTELTRKDRLAAHFYEMAQNFGTGAFDFVPETFSLPQQAEIFQKNYEQSRSKGHMWIVKPNNGARGKGIFILRDLSELPIEDNVVVSRYIHNPLLIQGLKFDLRVYVLVTSYEPLKAYVYREGLTRFASKPYSTKEEHMQDAYRHLTNYSINKGARNFVENREVGADNVGHKWSLSALNKHLKCVGVDVKLMWSRIMDLIVKSLLSVEQLVGQKARQLMPGRDSCFELYGFDVLVDEELKPWLLEVNLSPSLQADSPLDWQIKSALLADALNLVGIATLDRQTLNMAKLRVQQLQQAHAAQALRPNGGVRAPTPGSRSGASSPAGHIPRSYTDLGFGMDFRRPGSPPSLAEGRPLVLNELSQSQLKMLHKALQEQSRCENFVPLYPTRAAVKRYAPIKQALEALGKGLGGRHGSACQLLAAVLYGPPPLRGGTMVLRPLPMAMRSRTFSSQSADSASQGQMHAAEAVLEEEAASQEMEEEVWISPGDSSTEEHEDSGDDVMLMTPPDSLPPEVQDPVVNEEERAAALAAATSALKLLATRRVAVPPHSSDGESGGEGSTTDEEKNSSGSRKRSQARGGKHSIQGCCLVLAEYLQRIVAACLAMGATSRARLAQSAAYARLSMFQRRLPAVAGEMIANAGGSLASARDRNQNSLSDGSLVDELAVACETGLLLLVDWVTKEVLNGEEDEEPEDDSKLEKRGGLASRFGCKTLDQPGFTQLLQALANLTGSDLERLLRGPYCAGSAQGNDGLLRLMEPFAEKSSAPNGPEAAIALDDCMGQRRNPPLGRSGSTGALNGRFNTTTVQPGRLRPLPAMDGVSGGPLGELLRAAQQTKMAVRAPRVPSTVSPGARSKSHGHGSPIKTLPPPWSKALTRSTSHDSPANALERVTGLLLAHSPSVKSSSPPKHQPRLRQVDFPATLPVLSKRVQSEEAEEVQDPAVVLSPPHRRLSKALGGHLALAAFLEQQHQSQSVGYHPAFLRPAVQSQGSLHRDIEL